MTIARTICLGFIAVILAGTSLLMLPVSTTSGTWNDPIVALFTSTSAVCVTGLAVVDTGTYFSFWGQLFIALLVQVGGLGYMTTTTFLMLLIGRKFDLRQKLAIQESFDRPFLQGSQSLMKSVIATTLVFELTATLVMLTVFAQKYDFRYAVWLSLFHSISAWNNAGFGLFKDNLMSYQSSIIINLSITGLIIFGGIGYQVIIEFYTWFIHRFQYKRKGFVFSLNYKVAISTTIFLLVIGTLAFLLTEQGNTDTLANLSIKDKFYKTHKIKKKFIFTIQVFKIEVASKKNPPSKSNIIQWLAIKALRELDLLGLFPSLDTLHSLDQNPMLEEMHVIALVKAILNCYLKFRCLSYTNVFNRRLSSTTSVKNMRTKLSQYEGL